MAHGGTNFGFYNGANTGQSDSEYKADLTSYDYVSNSTRVYWCLKIWISLTKSLFFRMHQSRSLVIWKIQNSKACSKLTFLPNIYI